MAGRFSGECRALAGCFLRGGLLRGEDRIDKGEDAGVVVAGNAPGGMLFHVRLRVCHDIAVAHALEHGDVVIGIAHGCGVCLVDAELCAQMRHARALIDPKIHEVDPLAARVGDIQSVAKCGPVHIGVGGLGIPLREEQADFVGVSVDLVKGIDKDDVFVINTHLARVLAVALEHIDMIESAKYAGTVAALRRKVEHLAVEVVVEEVAKDVFGVPESARPVVGAEGELMCMPGEHLLQLGRRPSACGAKDHAGLVKRIETLEKTLGKSSVVGEERFVHIDGEQLDVAEAGVLEIIRQHGFPFLRFG